MERAQWRVMEKAMAKRMKLIGGPENVQPRLRLKGPGSL
jgi:hypothetical protein